MENTNHKILPTFDVNPNKDNVMSNEQPIIVCLDIGTTNIAAI
jgi:hypothetical protein